MSGYTHQLHIYRRLGRNAVVGLFHVRYNAKTLANVSIQTWTDLDKDNLVDPIWTRLYLQAANYAARCDFSFAGPPSRDPQHPMHVFAETILQPGAPALVPGIIRLLLDEDLARRYADVAGDGTKRKQFSELLASITCGSVRTWLSDTKRSEHMEAVDDQYLFGLTCVFAFAVDLLMKRPKCVMTDTTFKSVKPYTLAILHAIFGNESIPIAFAIWPSETSQSYGQLYNHILSLLTTCAIHARNQTQPRAPLRAPVGPFLWPEQVPGEDQDLDELPVAAGELHSDELPDPIAAEEQDSCEVGQIDADNAIDPDIACEEEHWEELSPAEMAAAMGGSERSEAYEKLRLNTDPDVWKWHELLLGLPIVTDQGKALQSFVDAFGLVWKLCHR
ncbi:MAG: hypothetical protein LBK95_10695, partial [Bifidobacteriaceae bacterium]|nr:hypothetical protein [Bifidobacteriaceae bacterium]